MADPEIQAERDLPFSPLKTPGSSVDYIHANPVRRGLVAQAEDWEWSSARWDASLKPVKIEMDDMILDEPARD